ncbi:MAG: 4-(cytidine 5'-diphospho)-2-C-methyl-D-erythritol kinase [Planctomycetota bacterium]|nr:MAG: 4-(cytidine 5'-diphospho)-2-C-methyl-D-erythritol kinase [Planctomycetota bacterium]
MKTHRPAASVMHRAPAKLNLFFEVLGRRDDGYHEIETIVVPLSLCDTLFAWRLESGDIELDCRWHAALDEDTRGKLPPPEGNLAYKAVALLRSRAGVDEGIGLRLIKRIPAEAGLGGASSDAAAALLAANDVWRLGWSRAALAELSAELGSDVPLFFARGPARCLGRGERVEPLNVGVPWHFVVVRPPAGLSTARVYAGVEVPERPRGSRPLTDKLCGGDMRNLRECVFNRLQGVAETLSPWIERLRREFARQHLLADQMSGSGTAYFGVCHHARHARRVARRLQARGLGRVYAVGAAN